MIWKANWNWWETNTFSETQILVFETKLSVKSIAHSIRILALSLFSLRPPVCHDCNIPSPFYLSSPFKPPIPYSSHSNQKIAIGNFSPEMSHKTFPPKVFQTNFPTKYLAPKSFLWSSLTFTVIAWQQVLRLDIWRLIWEPLRSDLIFGSRFDLSQHHCWQAHVLRHLKVWKWKFL